MTALNADAFATLYWAGKLKGVAKDQQSPLFSIYLLQLREMRKYEARWLRPRRT